MIPPSSERVPMHTSEEINEKIRRQTEANIAYYTDNPGAIGQRLEELDQEWDVERSLETNAAAVSLIGLTLGAVVNPKWFILPGIVAGFLLQHALQGWCPPLPIFRRQGFRTRKEIDYERYALKAVRGDFENLPSGSDGNSRLAVRRVLLAVER